MNPFAIPPLITSVIIFATGVFVFLKDRKSAVNIVFGIFSLILVVWLLGYSLMYLSTDSENALFWARTGFLGIIFIPILSYHFISVFLNLKDRRFLIFIYLLAIPSLLLSFTDYIYSGVRMHFWGYYPTAGKIYIVFLLMFVLLFTKGIWLLFSHYRKEEGVKKEQIKYVGLGFLFGTFGMVDYLVKFPLFYGIYPFGYICAIGFFGIISYAIVKRELFGIRVVLTQLLVGVVAVLLLVQSTQAVIVRSWLDFFWKFPLFLLFLLFGYLLIQSVSQEIERRAEVQRLYEEVDRLSRAKSEFISIVSHQLRTPLSAIKSYIYLILKGRYGKVEEKEKLEKVFQSDERLLTLVNDLLDLSRIESGTIKLELKKASLVDIVSSVLDELKIKANEKNLYLNWERKEGELLPQVTVDPGKIRQVILNIIDNCIKYTECGGITTKGELRKTSNQSPQGSILISIKDTGAGMNKEEFESVFESFTRGQAGAQHWEGGAGLGLYIARKFAEMHGGKVWAESEGEGKGSTFFVELPIDVPAKGSGPPAVDIKYLKEEGGQPKSS